MNGGEGRSGGDAATAAAGAKAGEDGRQDWC